MNHVKTNAEDNRSWCGESLGAEFYFKDAEHAALNGVYQGQQKICPKCAKNIIKALASNLAIDC